MMRQHDLIFPCHCLQKGPSGVFGFIELCVKDIVSRDGPKDDRVASRNDRHGTAGQRHVNGGSGRDGG